MRYKHRIINVKKKKENKPPPKETRQSYHPSQHVFISAACIHVSGTMEVNTSIHVSHGGYGFLLWTII